MSRMKKLACRLRIASGLEAQPKKRKRKEKPTRTLAQLRMNSIFDADGADGDADDGDS